MWHYKDIISATGGKLYRLKQESFPGISTDSRTIKEGELFIPLKGKRFDGHDFIRDAIEKKGGGTLCEESKVARVKDTEGTIITVHDTNRAFIDIARFRRKLLDSTFVAITGSCGKTTTKEILVNITKKAFSIEFNEKNYNNIFGVCSKLISIKQSPKVGVFELGTNFPGEIRTLTEIVEPDVSVITNVNPAHLEGLGSIEGILNEKLDIFRYTKDGGTILVNRDDKLLTNYKDEKKRTLYFGIKNPGHFSLTVEKDLGWQGYKVTLDFMGEKIRTKTRLIGFHNLYNVLIASLVAFILGVGQDKIAEGVEEFEPYPMRMCPKRSKRGYTVIDDTYNANPASMYEAVKTLSLLPCEGKKILVLGDMNELGEYSSYYHRELGRHIKSMNFDCVFLFGEKIYDAYFEAQKENVFYFEDIQGLLEKLTSVLKEGDCVLIKGSRALNMDKIVEEII